MTDKLKRMTLAEIELHISAEIIRQMQVKNVSIVSIKCDWLSVDASFNSFEVFAKVGSKDVIIEMQYSDEKEFTISKVIDSIES